jgi:hypothetical protein
MDTPRPLPGLNARARPLELIEAAGTRLISIGSLHLGFNLPSIEDLIRRQKGRVR